MAEPNRNEAHRLDVEAKDEVDRALKYDVTRAYERAAHLMIPRGLFPIFAGAFVLLFAGMAYIFFHIGQVFGGILFSSVVVVGLYVLYNNLAAGREPSAGEPAEREPN